MRLWQHISDRYQKIYATRRCFFQGRLSTGVHAWLHGPAIMIRLLITVRKRRRLTSSSDEVFVLQLCPDRSYGECYMRSSPIRVSVHWSRTFRMEAAPDPCQFLPHYETAHILHGHDTDGWFPHPGHQGLSIRFQLQHQEQDWTDHIYQWFVP